MASTFLPVRPATSLFLGAIILLISASLFRPTAASDAVLDSDGNPVKANFMTYYIRPVAPPGILGVTLALSANLSRNHHGECPDTVGLTKPGSSDKGIPVKFGTEFDDDPHTIFEGVTIRLGFGIDFHCVPDTQWRVQPSLGAGKVSYLVPGYTNKDGLLVANFMKVQKAKVNAGSKPSYTLQVCDLGKCPTISVIEEGSEKYLGVPAKGGKEFRITFERYRSESFRSSG